MCTGCTRRSEPRVAADTIGRMSDEPAPRPGPRDRDTTARTAAPRAELDWLFWDERRSAGRTIAELEAEIEELRRSGRRRRLLELARRFVERGRGRDTIRLFRPDEIRAVLDEIERSPRARRFVDPLRIRMYERFLGEQEAGR